MFSYVWNCFGSSLDSFVGNHQSNGTIGIDGIFDTSPSLIHRAREREPNLLHPLHFLSLTMIKTGSARVPPFKSCSCAEEKKRELASRPRTQTPFVTAFRVCVVMAEGPDTVKSILIMTKKESGKTRRPRYRGRETGEGSWRRTDTNDYYKFYLYKNMSDMIRPRPDIRAARYKITYLIIDRFFSSLSLFLRLASGRVRGNGNEELG